MIGGGNLDKEQLIIDNMNLVYSVIRKYYPTFIKDEDLIQVGKMGLCRAANSWIEEKGAFSSFAWLCIRNEIRNEFRMRNKSPETLSLDYEVYGDDGSKTTFGESIVGDADVDYIDIDGLYRKLRPKERKIFELRQSGMTPYEISLELNNNSETIYRALRKIKRLLNKER